MPAVYHRLIAQAHEHNQIRSIADLDALVVSKHSEIRL
jgi:hypothetical protein